ncbi:MAG: class I SAM-dependent methyltransferase [Chloroflexi bacterium]|nr:class I SAM-dependent methyltransferase [Chloroflexota bacterium]
MIDPKVAGILQELEQFGIENDAREADHQHMMLNIQKSTGEFLYWLACAIKAMRILEIGTSNGFSTLWLASAARETGGKVTTVEIAKHKVEMARRNFERAGLSAWIESRQADAGEFIKQQDANAFDLIFLDTQRERHVAWWQDLQRILAPGGAIVCDNAVSHAHEMENFVRAVQATRGYVTSLVPVGKGEFLILKASGAQ